MTRVPMLAWLLVVVLLGGGCGPTMADLPLPGSGVPGATIEVTVRFDEALNLAEGAAVKVNGVTSGRVRSVTVEDFRAVAVLEVRRDARMRANAAARLRYTTPLGELFVDVRNPVRGLVLADGDELSPRRASTAPTVEDALSSASLLINGGGLAQLQVVTSELNKALGGREDDVRRLLQRSDRFLRSADAATADFLGALDALAKLSRTLSANRDTIHAALRDLGPAARVLRRATPRLTRLLHEVERFSGTADQVVGATRVDLLRLLRQLSPVLDEFLANRSRLGPSLRALVAVGDGVDRIVPGDYANLSLLLYLDRTRFPGIGAPGDPDQPGPGPAPDGGLLGGLLGGLG
jgi:phospholipid/cholesterol/gamma-HCH transport system substrate-binding protein